MCDPIQVPLCDVNWTLHSPRLCWHPKQSKGQAASLEAEVQDAPQGWGSSRKSQGQSGGFGKEATAERSHIPIVGNWGLLSISLQVALFFLTTVLSPQKEKEFSHLIKATAVTVRNPKAVPVAWGSKLSSYPHSSQSTRPFQALGQRDMGTAIAGLWEDLLWYRQV